MDKLRAMAVYVRIVEAGSLARAADALGLSAPSVVRALAALERDVGVRLLQRTTRRSSLTDEGREYYERCRRVLEAVEAADLALSARRSEPRGRLRLTAPLAFGRTYLAPLVREFMGRHPAVEVELLLLDRVVDLVEEGVDAAVRIAHLGESSLVATRVGITRRVVCAAPAYLREAGIPRKPGELASHRCVVFAGLAADNEWSFAGKPGRVAVRPALRTNNIDVAIEACLDGLGAAQFLSYQVEAHLRAGRLRTVLEAFAPGPVPIQIVYPQTRLLSANVRAFIDLARERIPALLSAAATTGAAKTPKR